MDIVSMPSDLPSLTVAAWLSPAERRRVTAIARLLNQLLTESSAVITSADTLLTELFSHRGETRTHGAPSILRRNPRGYICVHVCQSACSGCVFQLCQLHSDLIMF